MTQGSAFKLTAAQSRAFLQAVRAPSLLLLASRGFGGRPGVLDAVEAAGLGYRLYEAHHHLHLGAGSVAVAHAIADFLAAERAV